MNDFVSPRPVGSDPEGVFHEETHDLTRGPAAQLRNSSTVRVQKTPRGIFLHAAPAKGGASKPASQITAFLFIKSFGDYIIGQNVATGALTQIAKPYKLRNSITSEYNAADAETYTFTYPQNPAEGDAPTALSYVSRQVADGVNPNENQRVTPMYCAAHGEIPADIIYAIQLSNSVVSSEANDDTTEAGSPITWIDLNLDGRAWAATPDGNP